MLLLVVLPVVSGERVFGCTGPLSLMLASGVSMLDALPVSTAAGFAVPSSLRPGSRRIAESNVAR